MSFISANMKRCTVTRCKGFLLLGLVAQDEVLLEDMQQLSVGAALRDSHCTRISFRKTIHY